MHYIFLLSFIFEVLQDFMSRAKTMEHLEEYSRLQKFAEAKVEDKALLVKHREIREKVCMEFKMICHLSSDLIVGDNFHVFYVEVRE